MKLKQKAGFTLIEVLVVVLIIAVLTAVAMPMYKRAVLKSRFSTVMPMAKSVADAQEVYYLSNGYYAQNNEKDLLDITDSGAANTLTTLSSTDGYDYVLAQRTDIPELHYIMYQRNSENYPGEIHCEAEKDNADANWICGGLSDNNEIGVTITKGYKTYLIEGSGLGLSPWANAPTCDVAEAMGYTCSITTNQAGKQVKQVCSTGVCRTRTYDEDGSYTSVTCKINNQGVCGFDWRSATYDVSGNILSQRSCNNIDSSGNCAWYSTDYANDYTYDAAGNMLSRRKCSSVDSSGNCTAYNTTYSYDYTYDAAGNQLTKRQCSSGNCTAYDAMYSYTYDAAGNQLTERSCYSFDSNDNCTSYGRNYGYNYTYDAAGNQLTALRCKSIDGEGNCTGYDSWGHYNYTYDTAGNQLTKRQCGSVDSRGNCTVYKSDNNYDYTYDAAGNMLSQRKCSSVDSSGNCTAYGDVYVYVYDDNGKQVYSQYCGGSSFNTATGKCSTGTTSSQAY